MDPVARRIALAILILGSAPLIPLLDLPTAQANASRPLATTPARIGVGNGVFWDGTYGWSIVGEGIGDPGFLRYDPVANNVTTFLSDPQGDPLVDAGVAWSGAKAYVIGGQYLTRCACWQPNENVLVFNPASPQSGLVATKALLFNGVAGLTRSTAAWGGSKVYVFGGCYQDDCNHPVSSIMSYDPATDTFGGVAARLPVGLFFRMGSGTSGGAVWNNDAIYIFGGCSSFTVGACVQPVLRFDPRTETLTKLNTTWGGQTVVWTGKVFQAFSLRAISQCGIGDMSIDEYDPSGDTFQHQDPNTAVPVGAGGFWTGSSTFLFSGTAVDCLAGAPIVRFDPVNNGPSSAIDPTPIFECVNQAAQVGLTGSAKDPEGDPVNVTWNAGSVVLKGAFTLNASGSFPLGDTAVTLNATDTPFTHDPYHYANVTSTVRVRDRVPPAVALTVPQTSHVYVLDDSIALPLAGLTPLVIGYLDVTATATDACGIDHVEFAIDAVPPTPFLGPPRHWTATATSPPYSTRVNLPVAYAGATVSVRATAIDLGGNAVTTLPMSFYQVGIATN